MCIMALDELLLELEPIISPVEVEEEEEEEAVDVEVVVCEAIDAEGLPWF